MIDLHRLRTESDKVLALLKKKRPLIRWQKIA